MAEAHCLKLDFVCNNLAESHARILIVRHVGEMSLLGEDIKNRTLDGFFFFLQTTKK